MPKPPIPEYAARLSRRVWNASSSLRARLPHAPAHGLLPGSLPDRDTPAPKLGLAGVAPERTRPTLPPWLWLWFPPLLLLILPIRALDPSAYSTWIDGELGLIELATPLLSAVGAVVGFRLFMRLRLSGDWLLCGWVGLLTLGCVYFAGEEVSWGQHLFGWLTPEIMERINDQQETNLHNVSSWFDQKPRMLLEIWVLVGGILVPLRERMAQPGAGPTGFRFYFWPTIECLPVAVLAIVVRAPERLKELLGLEMMPLEIRHSELQELYFALFLLLYLASLSRRMDAASAIPAGH